MVPIKIIPLPEAEILFFFFNDPATPETSPLPLHDALPIPRPPAGPPHQGDGGSDGCRGEPVGRESGAGGAPASRPLRRTAAGDRGGGGGGPRSPAAVR